MRVFILLFLSSVSVKSFAGEGDSVYAHARAFIETEQWDSAIYYANICLQKAERDDNQDIIIKSHFVKAYSLTSKREFGNAVIEYLKASEIAEFSQNSAHKKLLIDLYKNISTTIRKYHHYDLAQIYTEKALKLAYEQADTFQILHNSKNLVNLLVDAEKLEEARNLIKNCLILKDSYPQLMASFINNLGRIKYRQLEYDSARIFYCQVFSKKTNPEGDRASAQLNYAWSLMDEHRYSESISSLMETVKICKMSESNNWLFSAHQALGKCYSELGQYQKAEKYYLKAISLINLPGVKPEAYTIYKDIRDFYRAQGHHQIALMYNDRYTEELERNLQEQEEIRIQDEKYNMQLLTEQYFSNLQAKESADHAQTLAQGILLASLTFSLLIPFGFYYHQRRKKQAIVQALTRIELNSEV